MSKGTNKLAAPYWPAGVKRPIFDPDRKQRFIDALAEHGHPAIAAAKVGVTTATVYHHRQEDEYFALAYREAEERFQGALVAETYRRAVEGMEQDVWFQGMAVGTKKVYSDALLALLLKARVPGFNDRVEVDARVQHAGVLVVGQVAADPESWRSAANAKP